MRGVTKGDRVLIFTQTKKGADTLTRQVSYFFFVGGRGSILFLFLCFNY